MGDGVTEGVGPLFLQYPCDALFIPVRPVIHTYPWLSPFCLSFLLPSPFAHLCLHHRPSLFYRIGCTRRRHHLISRGLDCLCTCSRSGLASFSLHLLIWPFPDSPLFKLFLSSARPCRPKCFPHCGRLWRRCLSPATVSLSLSHQSWLSTLHSDFPLVVRNLANFAHSHLYNNSDMLFISSTAS